MEYYTAVKKCQAFPPLQIGGNHQNMLISEKQGAEKYVQCVLICMKTVCVCVCVSMRKVLRKEMINIAGIAGMWLELGERGKLFTMYLYFLNLGCEWHGSASVGENRIEFQKMARS